MPDMHFSHWVLQTLSPTHPIHDVYLQPKSQQTSLPSFPLETTYVTTGFKNAKIYLPTTSLPSTRLDRHTTTITHKHVPAKKEFT